MDDSFDVVTGTFGFTGKYIAERLLDIGRPVKTVTGHPGRPNPFGDRIAVARMAFDQPDELTQHLRGADTLYNTYWIRFPYGRMTYDRAMANSRVLIEAAERAGVRRIVHISIANADPRSALPYFRGKGLVEQSIVASRLSHAIVRPTVMYGSEGILINNIAWLLRRFPVFAVPGSGRYRLQPVFVGDVADIVVDVGRQSDNLVVDAVDPEIFTFDQLVQLIALRVHSRARILHLHPEAALALASVIGRLVKDVVITRDEVEGLAANLLVSPSPPLGQTRFTEWLARHAATIGAHYFSEMARHYR